MQLTAGCSAHSAKYGPLVFIINICWNIFSLYFSNRIQETWIPKTVVSFSVILKYSDPKGYMKSHKLHLFTIQKYYEFSFCLSSRPFGVSHSNSSGSMDSVDIWWENLDGWSVLSQGRYLQEQHKHRMDKNGHKYISGFGTNCVNRNNIIVLFHLRQRYFVSTFRTDAYNLGCSLRPGCRISQGYSFVFEYFI
jgi:hypothetical protein